MIFMFVIMGMQANVDAQTGTESMRLLHGVKYSSKEKKTEAHSGPLRYLRGDYLILILGAGAYIMIKRRKSRRIDL
jgi:ABC-type protease/lipase transport system fused ATPase/permease subunit